MKLFRSFSIYTVASFLSSAISFVLLPYLSKHLTPGDYGTIALFNTYVSILTPVMSVLSYSYISIEYFKIKDAACLARTISSIHIIPFVSFLFFGLAFLMFQHPLASVMEVPEGHVPWIVLIPLFGLIINYNETFTSLLVIEKRAAYYGTLAVARTLVEAGLTILFISRFNLGWEGRLYSWLIVTVLLLILGFAHLLKRRFLVWSVNWNFVRSAVVFGLPLLLHTIGKFIINQSDRLFLTKMISITEMGVYNVGYQLGSVILILCTAFSNSFAPFLYERLSHPTEKGKEEIARISVLFIAALLAILILLSVFAPWFFRLFLSPDYLGGIKYVFWVGLAYWFWGVYLVFSGYLFFFKKMKFLTFLAIFNVLANIILNYLLIRYFGAMGAAYATALSFFLVMVIVIIKARNVYPLQYSSGLNWVRSRGK